MKLFTPVAVTIIPILFGGYSASQSCYYDKDKLGSPSLKNCSTLDTGKVSHCCWEGHFCLEQNACWDFVSGATYQYGCTDSSYKDSACPKKCDLDRKKSPWVGLIRDGCSDDNKTWACNHPDSCDSNCPTEVALPWADQPFRLPPAECPDLKITRTAAVGMATTLSAITSLASGGPDGPAPTTASTSTPSDSLSSKTKLAIGLGAGLGGAIVILSIILVALWLIRRRRASKPTEQPSAISPQTGAAPPYSPNPSAYPHDHKYMSPEMTQNQAPGFKAELSADAVMPTHGTGMGSPRSELGGGEIVSPVVSPMMGSPGGGMGGFEMKEPAELPAGAWGR